MTGLIYEDDAGRFVPLEYDEWIAHGKAQGWCGPAVCYTHDGVPTTEDEDTEFEDGDPCVHIVRLYESPEVGAAVVANHGPSQWRL